MLFFFGEENTLNLKHKEELLWNRSQDVLAWFPLPYLFFNLVYFSSNLFSVIFTTYAALWFKTKAKLKSNSSHFRVQRPEPFVVNLRYDYQ